MFLNSSTIVGHNELVKNIFVASPKTPNTTVHESSRGEVVKFFSMKNKVDKKNNKVSWNSAKSSNPSESLFSGKIVSRHGGRDKKKVFTMLSPQNVSKSQNTRKMNLPYTVTSSKRVN